MIKLKQLIDEGISYNKIIKISPKELVDKSKRILKKDIISVMPAMNFSSVARYGKRSPSSDDEMTTTHYLDDIDVIKKLSLIVVMAQQKIIELKLSKNISRYSPPFEGYGESEWVSHYYKEIWYDINVNNTKIGNVISNGNGLTIGFNVMVSDPKINRLATAIENLYDQAVTYRATGRLPQKSTSIERPAPTEDDNWEVLTLDDVRTKFKSIKFQSGGKIISSYGTFPDSIVIPNLKIAIDILKYLDSLLYYKQFDQTTRVEKIWKALPKSTVRFSIGFFYNKVHQQEVILHFSNPTVPISLVWDTGGAVYNPQLVSDNSYYNFFEHYEFFKEKKIPFDSSY